MHLMIQQEHFVHTHQHVSGVNEIAMKKECTEFSSLFIKGMQ